MTPTNLDTNNIEEFIEIINKLLEHVQNKTQKESFNKRMMKYILQENKNNLILLVSDISKYISNESNRTRKEIIKKEPIYLEPPTFDQAVIDLTHQWCNDLEKSPELDEYFVDVTKKVYKKVTIKIKKPKKTTNKTPRKYDKKQPYTTTFKEQLKQVDSTETIAKKGMIVTSSDCQVGKTNFMICAALKGMVSGKVPILVTRNVTADADQLQSGCENFANILEVYLTKHGVKERKFKIDIIRGDTLDNPTVRQEAINALNGKNPKMIISLGNSIQLRKILNLVLETNGTVNLFVDEMDYVDYGKTSETARILAELKEHVYQTIAVSATPMTIMFNEDHLRAKNQLRLSPTSDYRGFLDFTYKPFKISDSKNEGSILLSPGASYEQIIIEDPNLGNFLKIFTKSKPDYAVVLKEFIPNICLINNSRLVDQQEILFDAIIKKYKNLVTMIYNGSGVRMYVPGKKFIGYRKINISSALQYLRDNGGVKMFPRIVIIAGKLAGRCISYVPKDYSWHLTDMYYFTTTLTSPSEMEQSVGRLCGRNRGKGHLALYSSFKIIDILYKWYRFNNETISRAIKSPLIQEGKEMNFGESIKSIPMNENKLANGSRKLVPKTNIKRKDFNLIKGLDGGESLKNYKYNTDVSSKNPESTSKNETNENSNTEEGKYFLILEDQIKVDTKTWKILEETEKIIINEGKIGKNISRIWINDKLLNLGKLNAETQNDLNGFWGNINKHFKVVNNIQTKGLLYWKSDNRIIMRLNM